MKPIGCIRTGFLLQQRAAGLAESERLRLEEHLSVCESCSADARALSTLRDLVLQNQSTVTTSARERAIRRALDQAGEAPVRSLKRPTYALTAAAGVAMAAAAAWLLLFRPAAGPDAPSPAAVVSSDKVTADRVVSGEITAAGQTVSPGGEIRGNIVLEGANGARLALGPAAIDLRADTRIKWLKRSSTVELVSGSLQVNVDAAAGSEFRVSTGRFVVVVAGTRFEVNPDGVKVLQGRVRISAPHDGSLLALLSAGQRWQYEPATVARAVEDREEPALAQTGRPGPLPSARTLLVKARTLLSDGKVGEARRVINDALENNPGREQRAEAGSLRAECALVKGNRALAARRYLEVANRFADLPAAENALFAAARLTAGSGNKKAARSLFERYMKRYPDGRFRKEVTERLRALQ